jgi:iron complex outermembrane receptor protein
MDLPGSFQFDTVARYVGELPLPHVGSYTAVDARLAWRSGTHLELALVGRNLLDGRHLEFLPTSPSPRDVERSLYGKVTWQY